MKVAELTEALSKQDPKAEVLTSDNDYWYYDTSCVYTGYVKEGREVKKDESDGVLCVLIG
jgi:hypothetical protein